MPYTGSIVGKSIHAKKPKVDQYRFRMLRALEKLGEGMKKDFEKTVETWEDHPEFVIHMSTTKGLLLVEVSTDDEIYAYVDGGTEEHIIEAAIAPYLVYKKGYTPKTVPRVLSSGPSSYAGPTRRRKVVIHPGTEPRNFAEVVQEEWTPRAKKFLEEAIHLANQEL